MEDRFSPGLFAGLIGDVLLQVYFLILRSSRLIDRTYVDYGKVLIMTKPFDGALAFIVGMIFEFIIGGLLGVIFSYLIKYTTSRFYLMKAISLAIGSWLFFLVPGTLYNLPLFSIDPPDICLLMLVGSMVWGAVTAVALKVLTKGFTVFYKET